jgi:nucleotide-binding universal stress UspA family protein
MAKVVPLAHILVLVDGTESSDRAADVAIELACSLGARLTAMAVVDTDTLHQLLSVNILVDAEMGEFEKELEASASRHLANVCDRGRARKMAVEEVLATGASEAVVLREAQSRHAGMIVLGGFHSSRVGRDLLARQRQQILDRAACPVLVVK